MSKASNSFGSKRAARRLIAALFASSSAGVLALGATPAGAADIFTGNLVVSKLTYQGSASTVRVGQALPSTKAGVPILATANGSFGNVFQNDSADANFGVTAPYALQFFNSNGSSATLTSTYNVANTTFTGSFSSKSEGAINVSADGSSITLFGYNSGVNALDISNSNTPGSTETGNTDMATATYRTVDQINANGTTQFTNTNAYSGNNPRAVILAADGNYYAAGNAGNGKGDGNIATLNGVQRITPGATANNTGIGQYSIAQNGYPADKTAKDNNFRGETISGNTLFVSKGSGGNGIDTVYQVGTAGSLPTSGNASTPISILPGFPTALASSTSSASYFPFGVWFANATTAYVADEGDGVFGDAAGSVKAGLEKWSFNGTTWSLDYVLQNGLNLGANYTVTGTDAAGDSGSYTTATDGLRNITGIVNSDGTVTLYGVTSTVSVGTGDQGADPDKLVGIIDALAATTAAQASGETFNTLETANYGEVLRGVALVSAAPEPSTWVMLILGFFGVGARLRARKGVTARVSA